MGTGKIGEQQQKKEQQQKAIYKRLFRQNWLVEGFMRHFAENCENWAKLLGLRGDFNESEIDWMQENEGNNLTKTGKWKTREEFGLSPCNYYSLKF